MATIRNGDYSARVYFDDQGSSGRGWVAEYYDSQGLLTDSEKVGHPKMPVRRDARIGAERVARAYLTKLARRNRAGSKRSVAKKPSAGLDRVALEMAREWVNENHPSLTGIEYQRAVFRAYRDLKDPSTRAPNRAGSKRAAKKPARRTNKAGGKRTAKRGARSSRY